MNSVSFGKEIHGIGWGKYINGELNIIYEQGNLFNLPYFILMEKGVSYFIKKEYHLTFNGYTSSRYDWVECELGVIMSFI